MKIEGLVGTSPAKPSFGMTLTMASYSVVFKDYMLYVCVISKEGLVWAGAKSSFARPSIAVFA